MTEPLTKEQADEIATFLLATAPTDHTFDGEAAKRIHNALAAIASGEHVVVPAPADHKELHAETERLRIADLCPDCNRVVAHMLALDAEMTRLAAALLARQQPAVPLINIGTGTTVPSAPPQAQPQQQGQVNASLSRGVPASEPAGVADADAARYRFMKNSAQFMRGVDYPALVWHLARFTGDEGDAGARLDAAIDRAMQQEGK